MGAAPVCKAFRGHVTRRDCCRAASRPPLGRTTRWRSSAWRARRPCRRRRRRRRQTRRTRARAQTRWAPVRAWGGRRRQRSAAGRSLGCRAAASLPFGTWQRSRPRAPAPGGIRCCMVGGYRNRFTLFPLTPSPCPRCDDSLPLPGLRRCAAALAAVLRPARVRRWPRRAWWTWRTRLRARTSRTHSPRLRYAPSPSTSSSATSTSASPRAPPPSSRRSVSARLAPPRRPRLPAGLRSPVPPLRGFLGRACDCPAVCAR